MADDKSTIYQNANANLHTQRLIVVGCRHAGRLVLSMAMEENITNIHCRVRRTVGAGAAKIF